MITEATRLHHCGNIRILPRGAANFLGMLLLYYNLERIEIKVGEDEVGEKVHGLFNLL
jgi:hypothetical protein